MTHYAVLRHGFDVSRNPARLGGSRDAAFWLKLGHSGEPPRHLVGNTLWLVSWEGSVKTRHMLYGWYNVDRVGKCSAVVTQNTACGNEGALFPYPIGPLDLQPWFPAFAESHRGFRDGEPTDITPILDDLLAYVRHAGLAAPATAVAAHT
ncbi:MAG: hypothetical protein U0835_26440 [Isosphaeraceae bacterium]